MRLGTTTRLGYISNENNHWNSDREPGAVDVSLEKAAIREMDAEGTPIVDRAAPSGAAALAQSLRTLRGRARTIRQKRYRSSGLSPCHEALCRFIRSSGTTLDTVHAEARPPITQRTSGLDPSRPPFRGNPSFPIDRCHSSSKHRARIGREEISWGRKRFPTMAICTFNRAEPLRRMRSSRATPRVPND